MYVRHTSHLEMKFVGLNWKCMGCVNSVLGDTNLLNNLGFSLCAVPSVYHVVITSDEWIKSEIEVSAGLVCCY